MKTIVAVFGNSGVGKSTLANALVKEIGEEFSARVRGDHFLRGRGQAALTDYLRNIDFDWELLEASLSAPIGTVLSTPLFDFESFQRVSSAGDKPFKVSQVNVIDSILPYPKADVKVLITLDDGLRKHRILQRHPIDDVWKKFIMDNWERERRDFNEYIPDLCLDGRIPASENANLVLEFLLKRNFFS